MQIVNTVEAGKAQNIIAKMEPLPKSWGMWCYTDMAKPNDHDRVRQHIWERWRLAEPHFCDHFSKTARICILITIATEEMRSLLNTQQRQKNLKLHDALGVSRQNLKRDGWTRRLDAMEQMIDQLDQDALAPLVALLPERG